MAQYLVYWKPMTVADNAAVCRLGHSASNQYGKLTVGDVLWIVTSEGANDLVLVGRQRVDRIVGQLEAERLLGESNLWAADYHAICDAPEVKANLDISPWALALGFDGVVDCLPDGFSGKHLQAMRRLDYDTEHLLERLWQQRDEAVDPASSEVDDTASLIDYPPLHGGVSH